MTQATTALPNFADSTSLLPVIAQDADTNEVLMLAYMNREAFAETVKTGQAVYFSRSRNRLWRKGEVSGHVQTVKQILIDCDADTILLRVQQTGRLASELSIPIRSTNDVVSFVLGASKLKKFHAPEFSEYPQYAGIPGE